jgi:hypothetical protein
MEKILQNRFICGQLANTIENFFDFVESQIKPDYMITKNIMLDYAGLDNEYSISVLKKQLVDL